jgi:hypothetical protein
MVQSTTTVIRSHKQIQKYTKFDKTVRVGAMVAQPYLKNKVLGECTKLDKGRVTVTNPAYKKKKSFAVGKAVALPPVGCYIQDEKGVWWRNLENKSKGCTLALIKAPRRVLQAIKKKADKDKAAKDKAAEEKAAKEKAAKEKAAKEKAAKEKAAKEKAAKEKAAREKAAKEKAAKEKAAKEKAAREKAEKEKAAKEKAEKEKADKKEDGAPRGGYEKKPDRYVLVF